MRFVGIGASTLLSAGLLFWAGNTMADEPASFPLADMCASCHGPDGASPGSIPSLAALNAEVMRAFLHGFREGDIESTVMGRISRALTDDEIDALAHEFEDAEK